MLDNRVKDISNSPAFTFLDGLLRAGKLSAAQVEHYKVKYSKLHEVLISTYQNEKLLLDKAKELKAALENEKHKLEQRVSAETHTWGKQGRGRGRQQSAQASSH